MSSRRGLLLSTAAGLALLLAVAAVQVWARSGSPWLWLLAIGVAAAVVVDGAWSWLSMATVSVSVVARRDAWVGEPSPLVITVRRPRAPLRLRVVLLSSPDSVPLALHDAVSVSASSAAVRVRGGDAGSVDVTFSVRGVVTDLALEFITSAPLGLIGVRRMVPIILDEPVHVAPARSDRLVVLEAPVGVDAADPVAGRSTELTRGLRPLVSGDGYRLIHWPATARSGQLMVREFDAPAPQELRVVVDLGPAAGPVAEEVARLAMTAVGEVIARGVPVQLMTIGTDGLVTAEVTSLVELGRRLADAVCGPAIGFGDGRSARIGPESVDGR